MLLSAPVASGATTEVRGVGEMARTDLLQGYLEGQLCGIRPESAMRLMSRGRAKATMSAGKPSMTARACEGQQASWECMCCYFATAD